MSPLGERVQERLVLTTAVRKILANPKAKTPGDNPGVFLYLILVARARVGRQQASYPCFFATPLTISAFNLMKAISLSCSHISLLSKPFKNRESQQYRKDIVTELDRN